MYETAWSHQTELKSCARVLSLFVCYQNATFAFCVRISAVRVRDETRCFKCVRWPWERRVACSSGISLRMCIIVVFIPPFVRHEAALWRSDRQHLSGEDHQPGEADRDLQPGRSESRQGSVSTLKACFVDPFLSVEKQCLPPERRSPLWYVFLRLQKKKKHCSLTSCSLESPRITFVCGARQKEKNW